MWLHVLAAHAADLDPAWVERVVDGLAAAPATERVALLERGLAEEADPERESVLVPLGRLGGWRTTS